MTFSARPYLRDIDDNICIALNLVQGRTLSHMANDVMLRYSLQHAVLIIAEAVGKVPEHLRADYPDIPWRSINAIGDKIRHRQLRIDAEIIWDVVTVHLKPLQAIVTRLLAQSDEALWIE